MTTETLKGRDILGIADLRAEEMSGILQLAADLKSGQFTPTSRKVL